MKIISLGSRVLPVPKSLGKEISDAKKRKEDAKKAAKFHREKS
jgi:hypothetical protein